MNRNELIIKLVERCLSRESLDPDSVSMLDVGCGDGSKVMDLLQCGYNAYGCDIKFKNGRKENQSALINEGRLRIIPHDEMTLPFPDGFADIVYSDQVVEHVGNLDLFFSEIARITKPGGLSFHYFPSINKIIEPHVKVPLATRVRKRWWIAAWQRLPVKSFPRRDWSERGVDKIIGYLNTSTNYKSNSQIKKIASRHFSETSWEPWWLLEAMSERPGAALIKDIPGGALLFNYFWSGFLVVRR